MTYSAESDSCCKIDSALDFVVCVDDGCLIGQIIHNLEVMTFNIDLGANTRMVRHFLIAADISSRPPSLLYPLNTLPHWVCFSCYKGPNSYTKLNKSHDSMGSCSLLTVLLVLPLVGLHSHCFIRAAPFCSIDGRLKMDEKVMCIVSNTCSMVNTSSIMDWSTEEFRYVSNTISKNWVPSVLDPINELFFDFFERPESVCRIRLLLKFSTNMATP